MADTAKKKKGAGGASPKKARETAPSSQVNRDEGGARKSKPKESAANKLLCPVCDAALDLDKDELSLFNRLRCEECEALLEVVDEDPVRLEWVEEEDDFEDDDDLDADEEEDDDYF